MIETSPSLSDELMECGYLHLPHSIDPLILGRVCNRIRQYPNVQLAADSLAYGYEMDISEYLDLVGHGASVLRTMGGRPEIKQVVLVPKLPREGRRNWHKDSTEPSINGTVGITPPTDLMLLYYLSARDETTGCLLVLPREDGRVVKGNQPIDGEIAVPVSVGDVVIFSSQLSHAALANQTDEVLFMLRVRFQCEWPQYKGISC